MNFNLSEIAAALNSHFPDTGPSLQVLGISTDTRSIRPGCVFVALRGERFDGHEYLADAFAAGAVAAVVEERSPEIDGLQIIVADTRAAYGSIARCWRRKFSAPVAAITGSVAKTTTKELTALALSPLGDVLKTEKNENNEVGLPKTLLRLRDGHRAVVLEMGMRAPGEIDYLAQIAEPTIGIVTVIGESHIERLGSREAIADAKGELLSKLPVEGAALINVKDDFAARLRERSTARVWTFGDSEEADFALLKARRLDQSWVADMRLPDGAVIQYRLDTAARHDAVSATAAIGAAVLAGAPAEAAAAAVQSFVPGAMRMEIIRLENGAIVLNDCYNAAPVSVRAALDTLCATPGSGRRIAILGDMKELGRYAQDMHHEVGQYAGALGIAEVYAVGPEFSKLPNATRRFADSGEAAEYVTSSLALRAGDAVLVKGSRAMAMEAIVDALVKP